MRTIVFFALTCFVSSFGAIANLGNHQYPDLFALILFGSWIPFMLYYRLRSRRIAAARRRAYFLEKHLCIYLRQNRYRY